MMLVLAMLLAVPPDAQPKIECDPSDPNMCAVVLLTGHTAPFAGTLMSPDLAISLGQRANMCGDGDALDLNHKIADCNIDLMGARGQIDHDNLAMKEITDIADKAAKQCQSELDACRPPFWQRPLFVAALSAIVAGGIVGYVTTR